MKSVYESAFQQLDQTISHLRISHSNQSSPDAKTVSCVSKPSDDGLFFRSLRFLDDILTFLKQKEESQKALDTFLHVRQSCVNANFENFRFCTVPQDYYDWPLIKRSLFIQTPIHTLCKSLIVENTAWVGEDQFARDNARFYLIIIQYVSTLQIHKVFKFIRSLKAVAPQKNYHFRMCEEADAYELSGFEHNAITPVGMKETRVPIILAEGIVNDIQKSKDGAEGNDWFWLGGGSVDLKLGMKISEFIKVYNPLITDVYKD